MYRGRFAPSPTGELHVGSAAAALVGWLSARAAGGAFVLRVEDIDTPRIRPGAELRQQADLRWLGLEGDEGPRYGGRCRPFGMQRRSWKRPPALRLAVPDREVVIEDRLQGAVRDNVFGSAGDFVLRRGDGIYAYQLAVVVDDLAMGITEVVRGVELLSSAPRQALLAELLGGTAPQFAHHAMVVGSDGARL